MINIQYAYDWDDGDDSMIQIFKRFYYNLGEYAYSSSSMHTLLLEVVCILQCTYSITSIVLGSSMHTAYP